MEELEARHPPIIKSKRYYGTLLKRVHPGELAPGTYFEQHTNMGFGGGVFHSGIVENVEIEEPHYSGSYGISITYDNLVRPEKSYVRLTVHDDGTTEDRWYMDMMAEEVTFPGLKKVEPAIASNSFVAKAIAQQVREYVGKPVENGKYRHRLRHGSTQKGGRQTRRRR